MATKPCLTCGKPFEYVRAHARFCSELCRRRYGRGLRGSGNVEGETGQERLTRLTRLTQERINQHIDDIVNRAIERGEICPPVYGRKGVTE